MTGITVTNLDDYRAGIDQLAGDMDDVFDRTGEELADLVVTGARRGFPTESGRAAGSVTAQPDGGRPAVGFDIGRAEHGPWIDFGGRVGRNHSVLRPYSDEGRYVIPALRQLERGGEGEEVADREFERAAERAGLI